MKYTAEQREQISEQAKGKTVKSLEFEETGGYWVMTFTDDSEISFRFMAELDRLAAAHVVTQPPRRKRQGRQ